MAADPGIPSNTLASLPGQGTFVSFAVTRLLSVQVLRGSYRLCWLGSRGFRRKTQILWITWIQLVQEEPGSTETVDLWWKAETASFSYISSAKLWMSLGIIWRWNSCNLSCSGGFVRFLLESSACILLDKLLAVGKLEASLFQTNHMLEPRVFVWLYRQRFWVL